MTVAHLYKYLWRQILKDLEGIFDLYSCLLEETQPEYIQKFAAQSFAFLFRKIPDKKAFLLRAFQKLMKHPQVSPLISFVSFFGFFPYALLVCMKTRGREVWDMSSLKP